VTLPGVLPVDEEAESMAFAITPPTMPPATAAASHAARRVRIEVREDVDMACSLRCFW
jgi:hypothetical protein